MRTHTGSLFRFFVKDVQSFQRGSCLPVFIIPYPGHTWESYGDSISCMGTRLTKLSTSDFPNLRFLCLILIKTKFSNKCLYYLSILFIIMKVSSILKNCFQWGSYIPCEAPTKESVELSVISNFHHRRPHGGIELGILSVSYTHLTLPTILRV